MTSTDEKLAFDELTPAVWTGFAMMCVGMFMAVLDVQVVATSLPTQQALNIEQDQMSWIQTAYLIAEIIAIPPHRISDANTYDAMAVHHRGSGFYACVYRVRHE